MSPLNAPPSSLAGFPDWRIAPSQTLYRIHRDGNGPWWFSHHGKMRFDLSPPYGTCYCAEADMGSFLEVFQEFLIVPRSEIDARRLTRLIVPRVMPLADSTHQFARKFGITGEIHTSIDRPMTQAWAAAFRAHGFDGVRYLIRHDPSQSLIGIALFGAAGEAPWSVPAPEPISDDLIARVEAAFGIRVV